MPQGKKQYAILWVKSDEVAYVGPSYRKAGRLMVPGTVNSCGDSPRAAIKAAEALTERIRRRMRLPEPSWVNKHHVGRRKRREPTPREIREASQRIREHGFMDHRYGWSGPWPERRLLGG